jgi:signal transduction histidine kinase
VARASKNNSTRQLQLGGCLSKTPPSAGQLAGFADSYRLALNQYLGRRDKAGLTHARQLGSKALAAQFDLSHLAQIHFESMGALLFSGASEAEQAGITAARKFFHEALAAFDDSHGDLTEHNRELLELNETLAASNQQLAKSNERLRDKIQQQEVTATVSRDNEKHYRWLFEEAQKREESLRNLSRQLLRAQEDQRKAISRELHDEVGQALTAISLQIDAFRKGGSADSEWKIQETKRLLQDSMERVHRFCRELRPPSLDDLGLIPTLQSYAKAFAQRSSLRLRFDACQDVEKMGDEQKVALYRVAQESLTNVAKHAKATSVTIQLRRADEGIAMEIKDNGRAFDPQQQLSGKGRKRLGLLGIQERMRALHGAFAVESKPGQGTTVRVQVPFKKRSA